MPWWLGPTYHGVKISTDQKVRQLVSYVVYSIFSRQLPDVYSSNISRDIWNFSRHLINYCLLISGFFTDPSSFSAENGSSSKHWLGIYPVSKGYMLFSFGIFWLWENHWKGGKNGNSTSIFGHSIAVSDFFPLKLQTAKIEGNTMTDLHAKLWHE